MSTELTGLLTGDDPAAWRRLGFAVDATGRCWLGPVAVTLDGAGGGLRGWTLRGAGGAAALDGLPTAWSAAQPPAEPPAEHPNGATGIDHVVVFTDARDRTVAALEAAGGDVRRRAGPPDVPAQMAFVRFGSTIVEVAQTPEGPARLWGLVAVVAELDVCAQQLGELLGTPRAAIQPGRRIATVRPEAGLGVALALITPRGGRRPSGFEPDWTTD